jgi:hypothetical protein
MGDVDTALSAVPYAWQLNMNVPKISKSTPDVRLRIIIIRCANFFSQPDTW